jgi:hypothetical protein
MNRSAALLHEAPKSASEVTRESPGSAAEVQLTSAVVEGWGSIKGQVIYGGASVPTPPALNVTSDQAHCLANGPLTDQTWVVDSASKGVANVVVFILPEKGEKLPVHDSLKGTPAEFVLDQPHCAFTPHIFALRAGQALKAKNPDPVPHNVVIKGLRNDINVQVAPGTEKTMTLQPETNAMALSCGSHPWMRGYGWCFDHPYFTVTDHDGKFEIKNIPAGARKLIIWHEKDGYVSGFSKKSGEQKIVSIADGSATDLGQIKIMPK